MKLLDVPTLSGLGVYIAVATLVCGILAWWVGKLLNDKKDITTLQVEMKDLERRVLQHDRDIKELDRRI